MIEPLNEIQQELAIESVERAEKIAERYSRIFPQHAQEFHSSALWGVMRAASSFDPDKGQIWERWSRLSINGEIKDFLSGSYVKVCKSLPEHEAKQIIDNHRIGVFDDEPDDSIDKLLDRLPEKHKELCRLVYYEGLGATEAGIALGFSHSYGSRIHQEAMNFLRHELAA